MLNILVTIIAGTIENFETNSEIHRQYKYGTKTWPPRAKHQMPTLKDYLLPDMSQNFFQMKAHKQSARLVIQLHRAVQKSVNRKHSLNFVPMLRF